MPNTTVTLPMPTPDPSVGFYPTYGQHFYMHYSDSCLDLNDSTVLPYLCAAYGVQNYGIASWYPDGGEFNFFQYVCWPYKASTPSTDPQYYAISSGVIIRNKAPLTITQTSPVPAIPGSWDIQPGLNMIAVDPNALDVNITQWCNSTNTSIVYGNWDPAYDGVNYALTRYYSLGQRSFVDDLFNNISKFRAGNVYIIQAKQAFTISFPRKNAYIVTSPYNTSPSGPAYYITTNAGDRLIANQSGVTF